MALGCGAGLTEQHTHEGDFTVGQQCFNQQPSEAVPCQSKDNTDNTGEWLQDTFRVMVYYRGQKVLEKLVENEAGFRLLYSPDAGHFFDVALPLVCLPPPSQILDQTQANLTACILENMGGGLEVTLKNNVVHGRRHGDCKVFWSNCKHDQSKIHRELSKHHLEPLLALKNFVSELLEFVNSGGTSPPMSLFFCLGEKWPDPKLKPWEKKLITVEVAFGVLEKLKEIGVTGGASSLRSVELQLSLDKMDVC